MMKIEIYWNAMPYADLSGYAEGDKLVVTFDGEIDLDPPSSADEALNIIYRVFNMDNRPNAQDGPSLSIGDVVRIKGSLYGRGDGDYPATCWAVEKFGFKEVSSVLPRDILVNLDEGVKYRWKMMARPIGW